LGVHGVEVVGEHCLDGWPVTHELII
jgi:hypothetical protein